MFEKLGLTRMANALASYSGARLATIAENVANSDTPGFRAKDLPDFESVIQSSALKMRTTRFGHFSGLHADAAMRTVQSGGDMAPNGNDVSLDMEMMKSVEARQSHEMALGVYRTSAAILRSSLGRIG